MASLNKSEARFILSAVISGTIFSTMSFVSLRRKANGKPRKVMVHSGVKAQTNEVTAPPKKMIPIAEAVRATSLAKIAKIIFDPGRRDLNTLTTVGANGATSVCFNVGIKNPSKAWPAKPVPY